MMNYASEPGELPSFGFVMAAESIHVGFSRENIFLSSSSSLNLNAKFAVAKTSLSKSRGRQSSPDSLTKLHCWKAVKFHRNARKVSFLLLARFLTLSPLQDEKIYLLTAFGLSADNQVACTHQFLAQLTEERNGEKIEKKKLSLVSAHSCELSRIYS